MDSNKHDASGQLLGYVYQILSALLLLISNQNPDSKICIEKFDDVAFMEGNTPKEMLQIKHHIKSKGNISDKGIDFWRTIKSWVDYLENKNDINDETKFLIITTENIGEDSLASYLQQSQNRNTVKALERMICIAKSSGNTNNQKYYDAFLSLSLKKQEYLVNDIYIYGFAPNCDEIKNSIMPYLRIATLPQHEESVYYKVVGWWIRKIIECLNSNDLVFISYRQLQKIIFDFEDEYRSNSLPIDVNPSYEPTEYELNQLIPDRRIFIAQLELLSMNNEHLKRCIKDYYNAYSQRSRWIREQVLFVNELDKYEARLIDEWDRLFINMKEELEEYGDNIPDKKKIEAGRKLFGKIEELNIPIRERIFDPFIMRGTFHGLSNDLKVGWRIDFFERLCDLLGR